MGKNYVCRVDCGNLVTKLKAIIWSLRLLRWVETFALMALCFLAMRCLDPKPFHTAWLNWTFPLLGGFAIGASNAIGAAVIRSVTERVVKREIVVSNPVVVRPCSVHLDKDVIEALNKATENQSRGR